MIIFHFANDSVLDTVTLSILILKGKEKVQRSKIHVPGITMNHLQEYHKQTKAQEKQKAKRRIIIIGSGIAAVSAAETLRRLNFDGAISIYSESAHLPYERRLLSKQLYHKEHQLYLHDAKWYKEKEIALNLKQRVIHIDTKRKELQLANHKLVPYDECIIATGAKAKRPHDFYDYENILTVRSMEDAVKLSEYAKRNHRCIVVGGGILGLELACLLADAHLEVTLIEQLPSLLAKHMDPAAAHLLHQYLKKEKIHVMLNTQISNLYGISRAEGAELTNKKYINTDFIVYAIGIQADLDFLKNTDIKHDQLIHVDQAMRTSTAHIYACGDAVRCDGVHASLWKNAEQQGAIAAMSICNKQHEYENAVQPLLFQHDQFSCFMAGNIRQSDQYVECLDEENSKFEKYTYQNGLCSGALLINRKEQIPYAWNTYQSKAAYPFAGK